MKQFHFVILFLILAFSSSAQNENNIWFFGDHAGLNFNSGNPLAISNGQINTPEGSSTISDNTGNLLFYTDGVSVWNHNHTLMPNGSGLGGHLSSTQSALIIPMPGNINKYYIFTIMQLGGAMKYSIVDMTLNSGFGDVIASAKNLPLHLTVSEKQTAIQLCDGKIWLISHEWGTNNFFADLITSTGISTSIISSVGIVHSGGSQAGYNAIGYMKISQQGNKLALAIRDIGSFSVFDFDINTGTVSNPIVLSGYPLAYGIEFSPDGTKLYGGQFSPGTVYQFDLTAGTASAIAATSTVVCTYGNYLSALQLASNGKIYVAKAVGYTAGVGFLDAISFPNAISTGIGYVANGVSLSPNLSLSGLPNIMAKMPFSNISVSGSTIICIGQSTTLIASGGLNYTWSGGISSTSNSITVSPTATTNYFVSTSNSCGTNSDTIMVTVVPIPIISVSHDTSICSGQSLLLNVTGASTYQWSGGASSSLSVINVSPTYNASYTVVGYNGSCASQTSTINVLVNQSPSVVINGVSSVCMGDSTTLTATINGGLLPYTFLWNNGNNTSSIVYTPTNTTNSVIVSIVDDNSCIDSDTINVNGIALPVAILLDSVSGCAPLNIHFNNQSTNSTSFFWNFGDNSTSFETNPEHLYPTAGSYNITLIASNSIGCADTVIQNSYIKVAPSPIANIESSVTVDNKEVIIYNNSLQATNCITYFGDGTSLSGCNWYEVPHHYNQEGTYTLTQTVTNQYGCSDTAQIDITIELNTTVFISNSFTPDNNGLNDVFYVYAAGVNDFKFSIYNRWGELIFQSSDILAGWDGTYKGKIVETGIYVWKLSYSTKKMGQQQKFGRVNVIR